MSVRRRSTALILPILLVASLAAAAGPPWIGVEYPANPHDPETRGALMVVRTYHHEAERAFRLTAEALGTVQGRRVTAPLQVRETSRPGVYAIRGELPGAGAWVVAVTLGAGTDGPTALVAMNDRREVLSVRVPHRTSEDGRWVIPRSPTSDEVDLLLRTASAMNEAAQATRMAVGAGAALLLLLVVPAGVLIGRRRGSARHSGLES